jgi:hypothetical protein
MRMSGYGYSNVEDAGFVSFGLELEKGAWKEVSVTGFHPAQSRSMTEAPLLVACKARLMTEIEHLEAILAGDSDPVRPFDIAWDNAQRRLYHSLALAQTSDDKELAAAAARLQGRLTSGEGLAQTQLSYRLEVDYGHKQVALSRQAPLLRDVKRVKLGPVLDEIEARTAALQKALPPGTSESAGAGAAGAPSRQRAVALRQALVQCRIAFNSVHESLEWLLEHATAEADRRRLTALLSPLQDLLARYPTAAPTDQTGGDGGAGDPAASTGAGTPSA